MKIRIRDRILVALAGLVLIAGSAALIANAFFGVDILSRTARFIAVRDVRHIACTIGAALVALLLGIYCFCILFRHSRKGGLVVQKTEAG